jgi:hypothetical protein
MDEANENYSGCQSIMKSIDTYGITKDDWVHYESKLCSIACSLGYLNQFSPLDSRINELAQSFFNQWQFVVVTYDKLYNLFVALNENSDQHESGQVFSSFDIESTERELEFKNYSYLLIVSMKTYLDLFSCLVDIVQNQTIKEEYKLPDFHNFGKGKNDINISEITAEFENLRDKTKYPWIALLKDVRNRIIHRGYSLKPKFGFKKSEELTVQVFKGVDFYTDVINIEVGKLFSDFMTDMPLIEERISNILLDKVDSMNKKLLLNVSFRYGGLINEYSYKETEPVD